MSHYERDIGSDTYRIHQHNHRKPRHPHRPTLEVLQVTVYRVFRKGTASAVPQKPSAQNEALAAEGNITANQTGVMLLFGGRAGLQPGVNRPLHDPGPFR
jgi:hypothetical protein